MKLYAPTVPSAKHGRYLPVYMVYNDVKQIVEEIAKTHPDYKRRIFGEDIIFQAPARYWDLNMITEKNIPLYEWDDFDKYSVRQRAELRAFFVLKGMCDVVESHYREQRELREREMRDAKTKTS